MAATGGYRSTVALKVAMAVTGLFMFVFVVFHLYGNLKFFMGRDAINHYAVGLRSLGDPILGEGHAIWFARIGILATVTLHFCCAAVLVLRSRAARPIPYRQREHISLNYASSTMLWGGLWLAGFVVLHLLHLTFGVVGPRPTLQPDGHPDVHANIANGFEHPAIAAVYLVSMIPLGLHLYHGLWSASQTLGAITPPLERCRRPFALGVSLVIVAGYMSLPLAVIFGFLQ